MLPLGELLCVYVLRNIQTDGQTDKQTSMLYRFLLWSVDTATIASDRQKVQGVCVTRCMVVVVVVSCEADTEPVPGVTAERVQLGEHEKRSAS